MKGERYLADQDRQTIYGDLSESALYWSMKASLDFFPKEKSCLRYKYLHPGLNVICEFSIRYY